MEGYAKKTFVTLSLPVSVRKKCSCDFLTLVWCVIYMLNYVPYSKLRCCFFGF